MTSFAEVMWSFFVRQPYVKPIPPEAILKANELLTAEVEAFSKAAHELHSKDGDNLDLIVRNIRKVQANGHHKE